MGTSNLNAKYMIVSFWATSWTSKAFDNTELPVNTEFEILFSSSDYDYPTAEEKWTPVAEPSAASVSPTTIGSIYFSICSLSLASYTAMYI